MLFNEPKLLKSYRARAVLWRVRVSVLFSEPKIPQLITVAVLRVMLSVFQCSSASRKFLNGAGVQTTQTERRFQCSSASRKFLNGADILAFAKRTWEVSVLFSEPKIPQRYKCSLISNLWDTFQCSSASRKFLNTDPRTCVHPYFRPR